MSAFLPQHESFFAKQTRRLRLLADQKLYQYDYSHVSPLAVLKQLPITDQFGFEWLTVVGKRVLDVLENHAQLELNQHAAQLHGDKLQLIRELFEVGEASIITLTHHISASLQVRRPNRCVGESGEVAARLRGSVSSLRTATDR